ncbi:hypothetical protein GCM10007989_09820 [Devosia pacifica]|uniref:DUF4864 domain-containing protein n=1 Tax=Devosia pacifica TaxID=1335967 RepID=A0A918RZ73_9HYPH|nr:DUF4864 domain-containing protein [Devosia pacifica]GHA16735.1 hypothetical protein GCM10007989_09820 [Devosia pacifica]
MRWLSVVFIAILMSVSAFAQEAEPANETPWQATITGQLEAFRSADAEAALEFAGAGFKAQFDDPELFYRAILATGYEPLARSRSHTFGKFTQIGEIGALQEVLLVGPELGLFSAIYEMRLEEDGWRVQGVALRIQQGIGA